jgi:hypothetical protein
VIGRRRGGRQRIRRGSGRSRRGQTFTSDRAFPDRTSAGHTEPHRVAPSRRAAMEEKHAAEGNTTWFSELANDDLEKKLRHRDEDERTTLHVAAAAGARRATPTRPNEMKKLFSRALSRAVPSSPRVPDAHARLLPRVAGHTELVEFFLTNAVGRGLVNKTDEARVPPPDLIAGSSLVLFVRARCPPFADSSVRRRRRRPPPRRKTGRRCTPRRRAATSASSPRSSPRARTRTPRTAAGSAPRTTRRAKARSMSSHWFPYDRVRVVNAVS